jgi:hypothetical protein
MCAWKVWRSNVRNHEWTRIDTNNWFLLWQCFLVPEKSVYAVILSVAKDLLAKVSRQVEEVLRFAQNDRLNVVPR